MRAPFSQERLSLRADGKVVYRLRRPWPNEHGATHLILDPLDFLRRLAANPPLATRVSTLLPGMEGEEGDAESLRGKPLCASVEGFSLHAAQAVLAWDREALERLLRYGMRAPFSQERLRRGLDGKVVYQLRRPWPNEHGATHLILEPLDFLRRLAALISFPY